MNTLRLRNVVSSYEGLFKSFEKLLDLSGRAAIGDTRVARALCELYAMMCAFQIRAHIGSIDVISILPRRDSREELPKLEAIHAAAERLIIAADSEDRAGIASALEQMGVVAFCPSLEEHFPRMDVLAQRFDGRLRAIPLVELSLFAVELGDFGRASKYAQECAALNPNPWEMHNVCSIQGLISLKIGEIGEAVQCLVKSINACQIDEYASLECSVRAPNLDLADGLLEHGERVEVLRYLLQCQDVWQSLRPQIGQWTSTIESGARPDFHDAKVLKLKQPSYRLKMQWLSACSYASAKPRSSLPKSPAQVLAGRERLRAENERRMDVAIKRKLQYLDNELDASQDQPRSNPTDHSDAE